MTKLVLMAMVLVVGAKLARARELQRIDVYDFGTYTALGKTEAGLTAEGQTIDNLYGMTHSETTRTIVARLGVRFGYRYHAVGAPLGTRAELRLVLKYPSPGVLGREPRKFILRDEWTSSVALGGDSYQFVSLDLLSDLVPGLWT